MSHPHPRPGTKGEPRGYSSRPTSLCVLGCWSPSSPSCRSSQPLLAHPTVMESSLPFTRMHRLTHQCPPWTTAILPVSSSPSPREDSCPLSSSLPLSHSSICGRASWAGGHCLHSYAGGFCVDPHQHVLCLPCAVALRRSSGPPPPPADGRTHSACREEPTHRQPGVWGGQGFRAHPHPGSRFPQKNRKTRPGSYHTGRIWERIRPALSTPVF